MSRCIYKSGDLVANRFNGSGNGDLILGIVISTRGGHVTGINVLTGDTFTKRHDNIESRNYKIDVPTYKAAMVVYEQRGVAALREHLAAHWQVVKAQLQAAA